MGKRKRVKANTNKNGNEETPVSTSSPSMEMSQQGQFLTTENRVEGGNSSKKMKRGESSNSGVRTGAGQSQNQETKVKETTMDNLHSENGNGNGEPSSSTLFGMTSRKEALYSEMGRLQLTRKRKVNKDVDKDEVFTEGPIKDLPPEMLTKILKCVDTASLFDCRRVSPQWLEISSEILTSRTDSILQFREYDSRGWLKGHGPLLITKNIRLQEFVECMKKCKNIPFVRFSFNIRDPSFFGGKDWIQFLSIFAPSKNLNSNQNQRTKIKYLQFLCYSINNTKPLLLFTKKLSDLLLNKFPRLEELELHLSQLDDDLPDLRNFKLFHFPKITKPKPTTTFSASVSVQLPYLKVLKIGSFMFMCFPGIIRDLLSAAVNLTKIHVENPCLYEEDSGTLVFQFLHSLGKLHLFKKVEIEVVEDFLSHLKTSTKHEPSKSDFSLGFKVEELKLYAFAHNIDPPSHADATTFVSNLLESSKDTLEKMQITSLGHLDELQFPKFTKLRTLNTYQCDEDWDDDWNKDKLRGPLFPPGIRSLSRLREIFPLLDKLNLKGVDWESCFPQEDSIPIFPSVHTFCVEDEEVKENVIAKLVLMCPNLKHLVIQKVKENSDEFNFPRVGRSIWTHLNQLESLEVDLDVNLENLSFPALDSCFTGISMENCQRIYELMKRRKTRKKSKSQVQLTESEELTRLTQREHPSILDMKNLKTLTMNPKSEKRRYQGENFFTTKITWISEEFAFKLMPHLEFNGRRPSTSS